MLIMTLVNQIKKDSIQAMKEKNSTKLATLRLLIAELEKERIALKVEELSTEQTQTVISRQLKKLDKEIEAYVAVGRETTSQEVEKELLITYLPKQLTEEEIRELAYHADSLVRNREIKNPMQYLSQRVKGKADMKVVARIVKEVQKELDNGQ
jgi:uncharacterized protein